MLKNKLVLEVPPDCVFTDIELSMIEKTGWFIEEGKIMRKRGTFPVAGTRAMFALLKPGDFLVLVESPLDDLHQYVWNMHTLNREEYTRWLKYE